MKKYVKMIIVILRMNNRKDITEKDKELLRWLIDNNKHTFIKNIKLQNRIIEESDKLLWKDFLLYFKKAFSYLVGDMYTSKISLIIREILDVDQELHVRKGITLTFEEWMNLHI